jgi:tetratricopeptide (TPR) repeat protein
VLVVIRRVVLLLSLSMLGSVATPGQVAATQSVSPTDASSSALARARALVDTGKANEAIALVKTLSQPEADDPIAGYVLGLAYYQLGDHARGVEYLSAVEKRMPESSPEHRKSVQLVGLSKYFLGQVKEAIPYLERATSLSAGSVELSYVLGISYIQVRQTDKARHAFARMFGIPSESASARLLNAQMMIRQRFEELAEAEVRQALALDPRLPQANFLLGELMVYRAELDAGVELFQKEIVLNPAFGMAYYRLGEAYTRQLKWNEAIAPLQKSIWLNPFFSGPYIVLGKVYLKIGDLQNAESILRRALQMDPNNFSGHHLLGQVLQQANRPAEAKAEFDLAERLRTASEGTNER